MPVREKREVFRVVRYNESVDRLFLIIVIILLCLGTIMIFSSSYAYARQFHGDSYFYVKRQIVMVAVGLVGMLFAIKFADYNLLRKLTPIFFVATLFLNFLTPVIGVSRGAATRWLVLPLVGQFQPSEILKLAVIMLGAWYITKVDTHMKSFKWGSVPPFIVIGVFSAAMYFQSHFSGLIIIAGIALIMIFIGEAPLKWLLSFGAVGGAAIFSMIRFGNYTGARFTSWLNPESDPLGAGFQILQSLYAIGSGGLFGVGLGNSRQKYLYLPEPQNDFIFSIICEETGFIGALIIISIFVLLVWRGFVIAFRTPDKFASLVVIGITVKVALQTVLNIAVVTNSIPNTGIPLPFFSYGGTALVILLFEMGIILSISRCSHVESK